MDEDIAAWEAAHEAEMELEREMYPDEDFNPKIKKKLLFDDEPSKESLIDEASSFDAQTASLDIDLPASSQHREKQSRQREDETTPPKPLFKRSRVAPIRHSAAPLEGPHMTITGFNGRRVFVALKDEDTKGNAPPSLSRVPAGQLLSTPIDFLLASLESRARNEALRSAEAKRTIVHDEQPSAESDGLLWVDKYSPKSFPELLSDEKINREILFWLKEWDQIVFGTTAPTPMSTIHSAPASSSPYVRKQFSKDHKTDSPTSSPTSSPFASKGNQKYRSGNRFEKKEGNTSSPMKDRYNKYENGKAEANGHSAKVPNGHTSPSKYGSYVSQNNGMPQYKAILLCGPPGLGKTTLAHVVARQAGYNPVEINASDDRKSDIFESRVYAAVAMQSVLGDKKPNCLIIDEIDGLEDRESNSAIDILVKLITAQKKKTKAEDKEDDGDDEKENKKEKKKKGKSAEEDADDLGTKIKKTKGAKQQKKKRETIVLKRPIICICNDMYVPALRKLRNIVKVFHFTKPLQSRITSRLKQICQQEGVVADTHTLSALVELTNHDTRSCLHTLQFVKAKSGVLSPALLASNALGMKDTTKGLFEMWREIFGHNAVATVQKTRVLDEVRRRALASSIDPSLVSGATDGAKNEKNDKGRKSERDERFEGLFNSVQATGEEARVVEGCFENYLTVIHSDHMLDKSQECLDWLIFGDQIERHIYGGQNFHLRHFIAPVAMAFAYKASAITAPSIHYPKAEYEVRQQTIQHQNTVRSFLLELPAELRNTIGERVFILDYISFLLEILAPTLRPVNPQLLNESEKATLARLVAVMVAHNLTYIPDKANTTNSNFNSRWPLYKLEPPIDTVARFSDRNVPHALVPHQLRQMLVSQITAASIQAQHEELMAKNGPIQPSSSSSSSSANSKSKPIPSLSKPAPSSSSSPSPSLSKTPPPPKKSTHTASLAEPKDFFGRPTTKPSSPPSTPSYRSSSSSSPPSSPSSLTSLPASPTAMRYKFNEGFSNAVRRTVYVKDFL